MAKLYCKVNSDIRAGLGCRGDKSMDVAILFSYSGGRTPDGGVRVIAASNGGRYTFKITAIEGGRESLVKSLKFALDKESKV